MFATNYSINSMIDVLYSLQLFADANTQTTGTGTLSDEMKEFYSDYLIDNASPKLIHDQFGQEHPIPRNGGKIIEFRKYSPLPKLTTPLTEGVTPDGQSLTVSTVTSEVKQYGGYITLSDILLLTAIDNNVVQATKLLGAQAGATADTITREVLNGGTNVVYAGGAESRGSVTGVLTVDDVKKAIRALKVQNAEKIDGYFVGIIHPDCSYDLTNDPAWQAVKDYDPDDWYEGEIGRIYGCRFVETTEAKIFEGNVYSTLILGDNAYGVTEISGGGLQHIVKQLGSAGTADPINQRATVGWKLTKTAERLVEQFMVRIESKSTFNGEAN